MGWCGGDDTGGGALGSSGATISSSSAKDKLSPGDGKVRSSGFVTSSSSVGDGGGELGCSETVSGDVALSALSCKKETFPRHHFTFSSLPCVHTIHKYSICMFLPFIKHVPRFVFSK